MGSMMLRPVGLAIAAPFATLFGIENFLYALAGISAVIIALSLLSKEVRDMSFEVDQKLS
jgi:uncharacterized membrane protein